MRLNRSLLLVAAFSFSVIATPAFSSVSACTAVVGNLISNCGFETGTFAGWTQGGDTNYTFVNQAVPNNYFVHSGTYAAGLGPFGVGTLTSNSFADTAGKSYTLSFYLYGDPTATLGFLTASLDGTNTLIPSFTDTTAAFQQYTASFLGTGLDSIKFTFSDDNGNYMFLDDVSVTPSVPEPSSLVLLGTGVLGMAGIARRRFLKA